MCCAWRVKRSADSLPEDVDALRALALNAVAERKVGSSSSPSSTPHVNAPCEPPPCKARATSRVVDAEFGGSWFMRNCPLTFVSHRHLYRLQIMATLSVNLLLSYGSFFTRGLGDGFSEKIKVSVACNTHVSLSAVGRIAS